MQDWFSSREIDFTSVPVADAAEATAKFIDGSCDAFTGDMSAMVAKKWQLDNDDTWTDAPAEGIWIAQELMSKEPLGAATRDYDSDFKDVVAWVWYGMVTAEENGVTSGNYAQMAETDACATVRWRRNSRPRRMQASDREPWSGNRNQPTSWDLDAGRPTGRR